MDDNTLKALTDLAEKLGTTSEYLWGVLLRQAPISSTINMAVMTIFVALAVFFILKVRAKTKAPPATEDCPYPRPDWVDDDGVLAWGLSILFALLVALIVGCSIEAAITGFVNPEYWALHQILK